jgi:hypothetical protein
MNLEERAGELYIWKQQEITRHILKEIQLEIKKLKDVLTSGSLLPSPALDKEYCNVVGQIAGLEFLIKVIGEEDE